MKAVAELKCECTCSNYEKENITGYIKLFNGKAAPWDDINFRFYYCNDHDFIYCRILSLKKYFSINIFMNPEKTQTNYLYTQMPANGRLHVPTSLGHMLMPSAQRWSDSRCCGGTPPPPDHRVPRAIKGGSY